ncbi:MAG: hypothetical protein R2940_17940 [Syntrophotaleaceae bacterium]
MANSAIEIPATESRPRPQALTRDVWDKTRLWVRTMAASPYYRYGEIGNLAYTFGKSILEGAILYSMFSMAQNQFKVAALLGVLTKYFYPAITFFSSLQVSSFVDYLEGLASENHQVRRLIRALVLVGGGQALGAGLLLLCYPPLFTGLFGASAGSGYLLIAFYLLHHICDGSAQVAEGRVWFKLIEIKLRHCPLRQISDNFWGIHAMSQNIQMLSGLALLWMTTLATGLFQDRLGHIVMWAIVLGGTLLTGIAKFSLPLVWKLVLQPQDKKAA